MSDDRKSLFGAERFELTDDLLKLARRATVGWEPIAYGAPGLDPKSPYGNSDVERDICEILGWPAGGDEDEPYTPEQRAHAATMHRRMETALQVILDNAGEACPPGTYVRELYVGRWKLEAGRG